MRVHLALLAHSDTCLHLISDCCLHLVSGCILNSNILRLVFDAAYYFSYLLAAFNRS